MLREVATTSAWAVLTCIAYYGLLFTNWGNYFHGGGPVDKAVLSAVIVLAAYFGIELTRTDKRLWFRTTSYLIAAPLRLIAALDLFYAIRYILAA